MFAENMKILCFALGFITLYQNGASLELKATALDICSLPSETGRCRAAFRRWFFNSATGQCEQFIYGGCGANGNNFKTIEECEARCDTCSLPSKTGLCKAYFPRWFFNSFTGKCERFIYGGCGANSNNFQTKQECEQKCDLCELPSKPGPCRASIPSWFYNTKSGQCEQFIYGGCQGNANRFSSKNECEKKCAVKVNVCTLPVEPGPCRGSFPRWYFDSATGQCNKFIYGGCQGNGNRFETVAECNAACDVCSLPVKPGPCRAYIPSWFYNSESGQCEEFIYGGCQGNANRFSSKIACEKRCAVKVDDCTLPVEPGPCRGSFPRWYFDSATGQCKKFIYGGCQGNGNRFETVAECNAACGDVCSLPVKPGPCRGSFSRYYFNDKTGKCERFIYGGCQGNANNFNSEDDCARRCSICDYPKEVGPCEALIPRWFFNEDTNKCEMFNYGGCQGNANNFENQKECESSCRCMRPKDIGPCDGVFPKYYYNNGQCQLFDYGGCEGNGNRFETKSNCLSVCSTCKPVDCDNTYCPNGLKKDQNGCINKKCQCVCKCKGNKCEQKQCTGTKCNVCQLPPDSGCGNKKATRWFYDASNNRCSQFRYSGKAGNGNNFKSKAQCLQACWVTVDKYLKDSSVIEKIDNQ